MRMRKKKNLNERLGRVSDLIIEAPSEMREQWAGLSNGRPIHLEIGCGKGKFICDTAEANPDRFYVALEKIPDVIVMAMERAQSAGLRNVRFIRGDASHLRGYFAKGEVERIYLNFSDPWPANRHKDRRLTSEGFLSIYKDLLPENGELFFKTDNQDLFDFSVRELTRCGWTLANVTHDLHRIAEPGQALSLESGFHPVGGAVTEYEARFSAMGVPINRLEARPPRE